MARYRMAKTVVSARMELIGTEDGVQLTAALVDKNGMEQVASAKIITTSLDPSASFASMGSNGTQGSKDAIVQKTIDGMVIGVRGVLIVLAVENGTQPLINVYVLMHSFGMDFSA